MIYLVSCSRQELEMWKKQVETSAIELAQRAQAIKGNEGEVVDTMTNLKTSQIETGSPGPCISIHQRCIGVGALSCRAGAKQRAREGEERHSFSEANWGEMNLLWKLCGRWNGCGIWVNIWVLCNTTSKDQGIHLWQSLAWSCWFEGWSRIGSLQEEVSEEHGPTVQTREGSLARVFFQIFG